jgi:hypothetical protein
MNSFLVIARRRALRARALGAFGVVALITACGSTTDSSATTVSDTPATSAATTAPVETTVDLAGVRLSFSLSAQTELVSPEGVHVLVDVSDPEKIVDPIADNDILLTTHNHPDHVNSDFLNQFRGQKLDKEGSLEMGDVKIRGLATVHNDGDAPGTDILFVIDIGDLRIVHFGDIGLAALPADQLTAVGSIDIAITQFDNDYSDVDSNNEKGFKLVEQLKPRLVIPTHQTDRSTNKMTRWPCLYTDRATVTLTRERLPDTTTVFFIGLYAVGQGKLTGATLVDW